MADPRQHWLPDPQRWAVEQERMRHNQALFSFGEYAIFVLMWQITDFEAGLVQRCPLCWDAFDKMARAYGQAAQAECPNCFGTTFEGGYKARIVRQSIWNATEDNIINTRQGEIVQASANLQSTEDFLMNNGDLIFRADKTRWQCAGPVGDTDYLHTGFQFASAANQSVGFNYQRVVRVDEDAVAYKVPPAPEEVPQILASALPRTPTDFEFVEEIRGPLL